MAYVVSAKWRAKEGKEDRLLEVIQEMTPPSRAEPGNVFYQAHQDSEHFTRLVKEEAIPELLEDRAREFYETIDDEAGGLGAR